MPALLDKCSRYREDRLRDLTQSMYWLRMTASDNSKSLTGHCSRQTTRLLRKDLKESIESALRKVKASGNPIAALNTTTKHDLDKYTDLELHVDWAETAQPMMRHLVTRCRIGADMTKVCGILDKYLAKSPEDIHDPNQEYIQMINDISTAWAEQATGETYAKGADDTQSWMVQWRGRHMISNDDETAHVNTNSTQRQPRDDGMAIHVPYKIPG